MTTRRDFLFVSAAAAYAAETRSANLMLLTTEDRDRIRKMLSRRPELAAPLKRHAEAALKAGPWSVTFHRPKNPKPARNDYYSEAPYWWPDPKNPSGPYIRKDGERYPQREQRNRRDLGEMTEAVLALGMGAALLGDARCAERAAKILATWFIDPATRMNPHLEFGQAVIGHNEGRAAGLIDTVGLIYAAQGILLLESGGKLDARMAAGLRGWYADFLRWMTSSKKGLDEKKAENNHGTWWTAQAAAFATFTRDQTNMRMAWDHYRNYLAPVQVQPDGSCPKEEARTRSLSYSTMNLDGFSVLCRIAQLHGVDLWRYRTPKGTGIEKAFHYVMPYVVNPPLWKKRQISAFDQDRTIYLGLAGLGLRSAELLAAYRKLPRAETPLVQLVDFLVQSA